MTTTTGLTLHIDEGGASPWVLHAMAALEEKQVQYGIVAHALPLAAEARLELQTRAMLGKVPVLVHDALWFTESLAISEYLAERFPTPGHPRIFPPDLGDRARARQLMMWLRTDLIALRAERPTSIVFGPRVAELAPMSPAASAQAAELLRLATRLVQPGPRSMFAEFCIADVDLAMALMRLIAGHERVPPHLVAYTEAVWARPSVQRFVALSARGA